MQFHYRIHRRTLLVLFSTHCNRPVYSQPQHMHGLSASHPLCAHGSWGRGTSTHFTPLCIAHLAMAQTIVAWVMVLTRKHYFVEHLESLKRRQRSRTKIENRIMSLFRKDHRSTAKDKQPDIQVNSPTPAHTFDRIGVHEGIGAALVGGGSAGIGLGIAFSARTPEALNTLPADSPDLTAHEHENEDVEVQSPKSITPSFEFARRSVGERGIVADAHSFTSSPRSGMSPLPAQHGPWSPGVLSQGRIAYPAVMSPRSLRYRPGEYLLVLTEF